MSDVTNIDEGEEGSDDGGDYNYTLRNLTQLC